MEIFNRVAALAVAVGMGIAAVGGQAPHAFAATKLPYSDIGNSFAKDEIVDLYEKNIMKGQEKGLFDPKSFITRAEFITVLGRLLNLETVSSAIPAFTDVKKTAWYYGNVQAAVQLGLADGTGAKTFEPSKSITRQEAAVLLSRALKQESRSVSLRDFEDAHSIAEWAGESVSAMHKLGLMKGDSSGKFRPNDSITREETAALIDRVLQNKSWSAEREKKPDYGIQLGWQYGQTTKQFEQTVLKSNVNTLSPRWYFIEEKGLITDDTDTSLITWAKQQKKQIWAMVGNHSDQEMTHRVLSDPDLRSAAAEGLAKMVKKYDLDGLDIDFENVAPKDKANLTAFVSTLAEKLQSLDAVLAVNVSPDRGTDWTEAFDYAALGKSADYIVLMGYDEHWGGSSQAGSVASLSYVKQSLKTLLGNVSAKKVILAVPLYTRDWTLNKDGSAASSSAISIVRQQELVQAYGIKPVWNAAGGQYVGSYTKSGSKHQIWMEDGRSLSAKAGSAEEYGIAGYAYWYMGAESRDVWASLRNSLRFSQYSFE